MGAGTGGTGALEVLVVRVQVLVVRVQVLVVRVLVQMVVVEVVVRVQVQVWCGFRCRCGAGAGARAGGARWCRCWWCGLVVVHVLVVRGGSSAGGALQVLVVRGGAGAGGAGWCGCRCLWCGCRCLWCGCRCRWCGCWCWWCGCRCRWCGCRCIAGQSRTKVHKLEAALAGLGPEDFAAKAAVESALRRAKQGTPVARVDPDTRVAPGGMERTPQ